MQDINVCICEDDLDYAQQVKTYILHNFSKVKVFVCDDDSKQEKKFNLYILDVELKHSTGFEIAKQLKLRHQDVNIIFLTTHEEFARKGYEYQASAYVSKNYFDEEFPLAIQNVMDKIRKQTILVPITFEGKQTVLRLNDIDSLLSEGHYLIINCHHEAYRVRGSFKTFFEKYPNDDFCSNMKGQYVNMRYIKYIDTGRIVLKDGRWLPLSRKKQKTVEHEFNNYMTTFMTDSF